MDLRKEISWFDHALWVNTAGEVLKPANTGYIYGVIVWNETNKVPILAISEVSDDQVVNAFIQCEGGGFSQSCDKDYEEINTSRLEVLLPQPSPEVYRDSDTSPGWRLSK